MGNYKDGMKVARVSAWSAFGHRHWRLFVYGPIFMRALAGVVIIAGVLLAIRLVAQNIGGWLAWLSYMLSHYLLPSLIVAVVVMVYLAGVVIFWRLNGWRLKFKGLTSGKYALVTVGFLVVCMTALGVGVSL